MSAAPNAVSEFQIPGEEDVDPPLATNVGVAMVVAGAPLTLNPNPTSAAIASNFKIMKMFCVVLPARTPRQLISVKSASAENQNCGGNLLRHDVRIDENPRADDAAHDDHRGVE